VFDCDDNPIGAPAVASFEGVAGFPRHDDNCVSSVDVDSDDLSVTSLSGDGTVWACTPSSIYGLTTNHVLLQAGQQEPAELLFGGPVAQVSFRYGAQTALSLAIYADGEHVDTLAASRRSNGTLMLTFNAPVTLIELRSTTATTNQIGLDDIAYAPPACPP
jgi:hypothetical protein